MGFCYNFNLIKYTKLTSVDFANFHDMQGEKRGQGVPGPLKKVLGLIDLFSPGTMGRSLSRSCPVPSRNLPGTYRDGGLVRTP